MNREAYLAEILHVGLQRDTNTVNEEEISEDPAGDSPLIPDKPDRQISGRPAWRFRNLSRM